MKEKILVVDDEPDVLRLFRRMLKPEGFFVEGVNSGEAAIERIKKNNFDLVITDLKMPGMDGIEVLKTVKKIVPNLNVIVITAYGSIETAVEAMKEGAFDYITKPFHTDEILVTINKALEMNRILKENIYLHQELEKKYRFDKIIGNSRKMQEVYSIISKIAPTNATVLIYGESGTGKELVAQAIHYNSLRKKKKFLPINCGALPDNLLESELFGHIKGSFTGAIKDKKGLFEIADGGTLFLDDVGDVSPALQSRLLRVLQEGEIQPVGETKSIKVDVRIVAATNKDLKKMIAEDKFREDLYYRLNVISISLPPLSERKDDIPLLVNHFIQKFAAELKKDIKTVMPKVIEVLMAYSWPGNVRELENIIERAVTLSDKGVIELKDIYLEAQIEPESVESALLRLSYKEAKEKIVESFTKKYLENLLLKHKGNITHAAKEAKIERQSLQKIVKRYGIIYKSSEV